MAATRSPRPINERVGFSTIKLVVMARATISTTAGARGPPGARHEGGSPTLRKRNTSKAIGAAIIPYPREVLTSNGCNETCVLFNSNKELVSSL